MNIVLNKSTQLIRGQPTVFTLLETCYNIHEPSSPIYNSSSTMIAL